MSPEQKEQRNMVFPKDKIIWQSIYIVGGQDIREIGIFLKKNRITVPYHIEQMIYKLDTNIPKSFELIKLVEIRIGDLNFIYPPLMNELYQRGKKYNFHPLPFSVIGKPNLYQNVTENNKIIVPVVSPITNSNYYPSYVLYLNRIDGKLQLDGGVVEPGVRFNPNNKIIFGCYNTPKNSTVAKK